MDKIDHSGHRERMRARLFSGEIPCGTDDEILETLLYYSVPRGDTRPMAEELIDRFGSLRGVASATKSELMQVKGLGEKTAILLQISCLMARKTPLPEQTTYLDTEEKKKSFFVSLLENAKKEEVWAAVLSEKGQLVNLTRLCRGEKHGATFSQRTLINCVLDSGGAAVVLVHNHPNGSHTPTQRDKETTKAVSDLLSRISCRLDGHYAVCGNQLIRI